MQSNTLFTSRVLWLAALVTSVVLGMSPLMVAADTHTDDATSSTTEEANTEATSDEEESEEGDDESSDSGRRAELAERITALKALLLDRRAAFDAMKAKRADLNTEPFSVEGLSAEDRKTALMERLTSLRAIVEEKKAALAAIKAQREEIFPNQGNDFQGLSVEEKKAALMEHLQALRESLAEKKGAQDDDEDEQEEEEENEDGDDESLEFTIDDVASVTSEAVDPSAEVIDDEYTLYTVTLTDTTVIEVKIYGNMDTEMEEQAWSDAGYEGDIAAIIALIA